MSFPYSKPYSKRRSVLVQFSLALVLAALVGAVAGAQAPQTIGQAPAGPRCKFDGVVKSGTAIMPGASVLIYQGTTLKNATSADINGRFTINFPISSAWHLKIEMTGFTSTEHDLTFALPPCDQKMEDFQLSLLPRDQPLPQMQAAAPAGNPAPAGAAQTGQAQTTGAATGAAATTGAAVTTGAAATTGATTPVAGARAGAPAGTPAQTAGTAAGRAAGAGRATGAGANGATGAGRFTQLDVQSQANTATLDVNGPENAADLQRILPPGFTLQSAGASAVAINGSGDATRIDNSMMNDRMNAIGMGTIDPNTFAAGIGSMGGFGGDNGFGAGQVGAGGFGQGGPGGGGRGGGGGDGGGGRGGPGGGGFQIGGRGGRGQSPYSGSINNTYSGSALDSPPFQLRKDVPVSQPAFARNNYGATFGGPLKIPGIYKDTARRSNFQANYTGSQASNVFDQYATVPTAAVRAGDLSFSPLQLYDPVTGKPFVNNQVPISASAATLLPYIPLANLPGATNNYHTTALSPSSSNGISIRLTQNLSPTVPQRGGPGGGRGGAGGGGGRGGAGGGPGGRGGRGLTINLTTQLQYRENDSQSLSVFPGLGSANKSTNITVPVSVNIAKGRTSNSITFNYTRSRSSSTNLFSGVNNVAGQAGILYPPEAVTDPLNYGVPSISFSGSGFTGLRGPTANQRNDDRITTSYVWSRAIRRHQLRIGADYRDDLSSTENNGNARGSFTFTGLYSSNGAQISGVTGSDFADFLMGLTQQATLQVGGITHLRARSFDGYLEDNWTRSAKLTFQLGLRYDLTMPYVEENGQMANLDVAPDFSAVQVVLPGQTGKWSGVYPTGLVSTDKNAWAPRIGAAYRLGRNVLRGGYSIQYNSGSYSTIARNLVAQPPFSATENVIGTPGAAPLYMTNALLTAQSTASNTFGVDKDYKLGMIQIWNANLSRTVKRVWSFNVGYTGTKGTDLDVLRAPNRGPNGLTVPTVQAFTWESSGAHSILQQMNASLRRGFARGFSGGVSYTLSKSMDDASSLGGGGGTVAQNDQDLGAEWARSSLERRHQMSADTTWEIPFGKGRRWLTNGGFMAQVIGDWGFSANFNYSSGAPLTVRVVGAAGNVAGGSNGSLRADYVPGQPTVAISQVLDINGNPTGVMQYINKAAFTVPVAGTFGNSPRNFVTGPGSHQLNANFNRDVRLGGTKFLTLSVNVNNLLNTMNWGSIDTNRNSSTFGQVRSLGSSRTMTISARFRF